MNLFSFMGIPDCGAGGCGNPGLVRVELDGPAGPVWVHLCVACMSEVRNCMATLSEVQNEAEAAESQIGTEQAPPPAGYLGLEQAP